MKKVLYQELAQLVGAYYRCLEDEKKMNENVGEWAHKHKNKIQEYVRQFMPSGSGFDNGTKIVLEECTEEKLVFSTEFHHMDDNGFYDGWTEHKVIVTPSLAFGFHLRITGRDRKEIKEYIHTSFHCSLSQLVEE